MRRRDFLGGVIAGGASLVLGSRCAHAATSGRFFFTSQGKTAMMNGDGSGLRYLEFDIPNQVTWQPGGSFSDGRRVIFLSMEERRDGPGKPFGEYYHKTPTHIWIYDLDDESLVEIANKDRIAPFYTPQLLLGDERILVQVIKDGVAAYHLAGPEGYVIQTSDLEGKNRALVAKKPGHLYFAPEWSPDGEWLIFQDCEYEKDPGHDWSDLCLSRPDGSEQRLLTEGQALWFAATYGPADRHGGGSNVPIWSKDGSILCCRRLPGSKVPWEYQAHRPDTDHFNRDFKPDGVRGGTEICRVDPVDGSYEPIVATAEGTWKFRQSESPDGKHILFCRAETGGSPAIGIVDADGSNTRELTKGLGDLGADHPRWIG